MNFTFYRDQRDESCIFCDNRKIWLLKDAKGGPSKYYYYSGNADEGHERICKIEVDGCLFSDSLTKCDFILDRCDHDAVYYVELKGSDLEKAASQITETINRTAAHRKRTITVNGRAVLSKTRAPDIRSTTITRLRALCKQLGGGTFAYKSIVMRENSTKIID